jgi:hypothetical protein
MSLVEVMIAMTICTIAMASLCSLTLHITRSSLAAVDYNEMDTQARRGLELFSKDARMASDVTIFTDNSVQLTVETTTTPRVVTYTFVPETGVFYQNYGLVNQKELIANVTNFSFKGYSTTQTETIKPLEIKQLQLELVSSSSSNVRARASNSIVSARYVLRNKRVNN